MPSRDSYIVKDLMDVGSFSTHRIQPKLTRFNTEPSYRVKPNIWGPFELVPVPSSLKTNKTTTTTSSTFTGTTTTTTSSQRRNPSSSNSYWNQVLKQNLGRNFTSASFASPSSSSQSLPQPVPPLRPAAPPLVAVEAAAAAAAAAASAAAAACRSHCASPP
ncbi:hypothetical protein Ahia01_000982800, partial [Argonauta hians]